MKNNVPSTFNSEMARDNVNQSNIKKEMERSEIIKRTASLCTKYILREIYDQCKKGIDIIAIVLPESLKDGYSIDVFEIYSKELEKRQFKCKKRYIYPLKFIRDNLHICISLYGVEDYGEYEIYGEKNLLNIRN
jgi:hypothetical protein